MPLGLNDEAFRQALLVGGLNILGSGAQGANLGQVISPVDSFKACRQDPRSSGSRSWIRNRRLKTSSPLRPRN